MKRLLLALLFAQLAALDGRAGPTSERAIIHWPGDAVEMSYASLACKLRIGTNSVNSHSSPTGDVTCNVISPLKGMVGDTVRISWVSEGLVAGEVYLVLLRGEGPPYQVYEAMPAVASVVEPRFGLKPGDRFMAELAAMWRSTETRLRLAAIEQIGIIRDQRGTNEVNAAAQSRDADTARAGVIAQYRMGITPDAKRVMELFDPQVMQVWYNESGVPQKDAHGKNIWRREGGRSFLERGLPDFDYATYVREGIKLDWVRKDDHSLYLFFGAPWKIQRKACVPELMPLLQHSEKKVRWYGVKCLTHTIEDVDAPKWEYYEKSETSELAKWQSWWKEKGPAYLAEPGK